MNWRSPRFLIALVIVCVVLMAGIGVIVGTVVLRSGHTQDIGQTIPHNEHQVVEAYNQAMIKQDWQTIYTSTAVSARGSNTQEEFNQLMMQKEQENGNIVSITPISDLSAVQVKTTADGSTTYFTVSEKMTIVKNGISQSLSVVSLFILEHGTWKYLTSKKI